MSDYEDIFKKVLNEGIKHKEEGQGISVKVNSDSIEMTIIPQPIVVGGGGGGTRRRQPKKSFTIEEVEGHLMEFMDSVSITDEKDHIKVLPKRFLGNDWDPINDKIKEFVGGYCWIKDIPGKEKHWRIPKK